MAVPSAQARSTIKAAFERFKRSVTADDARRFQDTNLNDVWDTAAEIEDKLANSKSLRNMRRIEPFLRGLEHYASVVEVLCNGTDYLSWIWAPIKLMLQLSSEYLSSLEKLLKAYEMICDNMPRFEKFGVAFQKDPDVQQVLALFYADILEFHRRAYKFFRAKAWTRFFHTSWGRFDGRFKAILENIARDSELIDKNANAIDILHAKEFRDKQNEYITQREKQEEAAELASAITWLQINQVHDQEEEVDRLNSRCHPRSCDWIFQLERVRKWMTDDETQPIIWLHGKPGAGKSVICSSVIRSLQKRDSLVLYFFCTYRSLESSNTVHVLRSLAAQILRRIPECAADVYYNYIGKGETASIGNIRQLLPHLLSAAPLTRIVLDGLDECAIEDQTKTLKAILPMIQDESLNCRVLISSREVPGISRALSQKAKISLSEENKSINMAIEYFIKDKLADLQQLQQQNELVESLKKTMNEKAQGMFLWVNLVLNSMEETYSLQDLQSAIDTLPKGLTDLYSRILSTIKDRWSERNPRNLERGIRTLQWILHARRPLRRGELIDAIALTQESLVIDESTKLFEEILEICKPLVEEGPNDTLVLIHFSLKEYLGQPNCGLPTSERESHHNITLACVAMLVSGLDLLDPTYGESQRLLKTGNGFLTLLPYAHSFWTYHLHRLAQLDSGLSEDKAVHVIRCLNDFASKHDLILQRSPEIAVSQPSGKMLQANNIQGLDCSFSFYDLVSKAIAFCQKLQNEPCDTGPELERFGLNHDPTLLSQLIYSYEQTIQRLLSADAVSNLSDKSLAAFKRFHGSVSYLCRFGTCRGASRGFATSEKRDEHERSMHRRFHCTNSTCQYRQIGFKTSKQLKEHLRSFHSDSGEPSIPNSIGASGSGGVGSDTAAGFIPRPGASPDPVGRGFKRDRTQETPTNETHGYSIHKEKAPQERSAANPPPHQRLQQVILAQLRQSHRPQRGTWQATLNAEQRAGMLWNVYTAIRLAKPDSPDQQVLQIAFGNENERFIKSGSRDEYVTSIKGLLQRLQGMRQLNEQTKQSHIQVGDTFSGSDSGTGPHTALPKTERMPKLLTLEDQQRLEALAQQLRSQVTPDEENRIRAQFAQLPPERRHSLESGSADVVMLHCKNRAQSMLFSIEKGQQTDHNYQFGQQQSLESSLSPSADQGYQNLAGLGLDASSPPPNNSAFVPTFDSSNTAQHQQTQGQEHTGAQAHREHWYLEEVAAAQQRDENTRRLIPSGSSVVAAASGPWHDTGDGIFGPMSPESWPDGDNDFQTVLSSLAGSNRAYSKSPNNSLNSGYAPPPQHPLPYLQPYDGVISNVNPHR